MSRREHEGDKKEVIEYEIPAIDLVVVDLYPFEKTVESGASSADIIEKIDIGGISLIRAAAKNFNDVVIVPSKEEYSILLNILKENGAQTHTCTNAKCLQHVLLVLVVITTQQYMAGFLHKNRISKNCY